MEFTSEPPASSHPGVLHFIPPNLSAFEPTKVLVRSVNVNTLLWIGGLFDTPLSVSYPMTLAQALPNTWSLMTATLSSAGHSWGTTTIARDAEEIAKIIADIRERRPGGKVVIMGHSTGCQDCVEYMIGKGVEQRPPVDGVILQAPVSDREAMDAHLPKAFVHEANELALKMCREGKDKDAMPYQLSKQLFGRVAITARRWVDIASPAPDHTGADDFFSSDLVEERLKKIFGELPGSAPLLILYGGSDESVPGSVDKEALVNRWTDVVKSSTGSVDDVNGGVVAGASHNYNGCSEPVVQDMISRVVTYVGRLDRGDFIQASGASRM